VHFEDLVVSESGQLEKIDPGDVSDFSIAQNGISSIDMPDFYLAHTDTAKPSDSSPLHTGAELAGEIDIPGGVNTLRFGGVDADYTPSGGTPLNQSGQSNEFAIELGLPQTTGTSVIVNSITSDAQSNSTSGSPAYQDMVTFDVQGRLNLFQANTIYGNTALPPSQFSSSAVSSSSLAPGGTYIVSTGTSSGTPGQIGNVRIGGAATNLTTIADEYPFTETPTEGALDAKVSNFFIGGETNNVILLAPSGSRNVSFGLGMDNVTINSLLIQTLRVNRDVTDSNVTVSRSISSLQVGGDVTDSVFTAGQSQSLFTDAAYPATSLLATSSGVFFGSSVPTVTDQQVNPTSGVLEPFAQAGGSITLSVAGNVTNSVFAASVNPDPTTQLTPVFEQIKSSHFPYGAPDNLILPKGSINAKVEGVIDNSGSTIISANAANVAFFAKSVKSVHGPVIPPSVPYQPYVAPTVYGKGQTTLKGLIKVDHFPADLHASRLRTTKKK
jgi:hypothetical protein